MGARTVLSVAVGLILFVTLSGSGHALVGDLESVSREALQAYNASDYDRAIEKGREALKLARKSDNKQAVGAILSFLGGIYSDLENYEEALKCQEEALAIQKEIGNINAVGAALISIGSIYREMGEYEKALSSQEEALVIKKESGDRQGIGATLTDIGIVYSSLGRYEKALGCFEEALAIDKEIGNRQGIGANLAEIGIVYSYTGRYEKALNCFDEALAIHKEIDARKDIAGDLAEIGIVYSYLDQHEKALGYFNEALAIHKEIGTRTDIAGDLAEVGIVYSSLGQNEKALSYFDEALAMHKEIGARTDVAGDLAEIGTLNANLGRNEKALGYYQESLTIDKNIGDLDGVASNFISIGIVQSGLGLYEKAHETLEESLKIGTEIGSPEILWRALCKLGEASAKLGKDLEAVSHYGKALDTIETMRAGLSEKEAKITFMSGKIFVYDGLIELYQKMHAKDPSKGYDKKALEIFERKHGRVFLEEMGKSGARNFAGLPGTVKDREADLENQMEQVKSGIVEERSKESSHQSATRLQALEADFQQLQAASHTLQEEIRTMYPDYYALKYPAPAGLEDIQEKVLGPDEVMLVYGVMKESACLWVIGKDRFGFYPVNISEDDLGQKISSFRKDIQSILKSLTSSKGSRQEIEEKIEADTKVVSLEGLELYELLIPKNVREALSDAKTLYIVPSGPLYGLPFEALVTRIDEGPAVHGTDVPPGNVSQNPRYLVEDYPIAYLSSVSLLKNLREAQARKAAKSRFPLLAFANPVYGKSQTPGTTRGESRVGDLRARAYLDLMGGTFLELPETEEEAREIKTILMAPDSSMPLQLRQDASRSNVLKLNEAQKLADYRYVVFSCHGVVPEVTNRVSQPALVLSQPDPEGGTGFLTMADTFGLRLNADLVTLSACNTGRGQEIRGEGVMGLTRTFMYAGTSAISVTLWPVESISAEKLSTGLYQNLQAGKGRADALREIKLRMIHGEEDEAYRYPFFWAPVVLFGEGR